MSTPAGGWRRSALIGIGLAAALVVIGTVGYLTSDHDESVNPPATERVKLVSVPGGTAVTSQEHGPATTTAGRARGFTHDELGAAVAASNIAPRVTPAAGSDIYVPTLAEQCWGDLAAANVQLATTLPQLLPGRDELSARAFYYRVIAGDPQGDYVVISLLADTAQARADGGLARVDTTLRWVATDWQLRVPLPGPSIQRDVTGYTLLGPNA